LLPHEPVVHAAVEDPASLVLGNKRRESLEGL
jgi:hypothetical protein